MPILKNEMVETAYPLRDAVTEYAESIIFIQSRTIDPSIYGQDIAATKMERIPLLTNIRIPAKPLRVNTIRIYPNIPK